VSPAPVPPSRRRPTGGPQGTLPGEVPAPTRHQLLDVAASMHEFGRALRGMAVMVEDGDQQPDSAEFVAAVRSIARTVDRAAVRLSEDDPQRPLSPGEVGLTEYAALLLGTLWDSGREGFEQSVGQVAQAQKEKEGKP
jgi:hypothetical protein